MATPGFFDSERECSPHVKGMMRLPKEEVDLILSWEHRLTTADDDERSKLRLQEEMDVDETMQSIIRESSVFKTGRKKFLEFQDWVRGELNVKGYVEVPDELIAERKQAREWMEQGLNEMLESIDFSGEYDFGNYNGVNGINDGQEDQKRRRKLL